MLRDHANKDVIKQFAAPSAPVRKSAYPAARKFWKGSCIQDEEPSVVVDKCSHNTQRGRELRNSTGGLSLSDYAKASPAKARPSAIPRPAMLLPAVGAAAPLSFEAPEVEFPLFAEVPSPEAAELLVLGRRETPVEEEEAGTVTTVVSAPESEDDEGAGAAEKEAPPELTLLLELDETPPLLPDDEDEPELDPDELPLPPLVWPTMAPVPHGMA